MAAEKRKGEILLSHRKRFIESEKLEKNNDRMGSPKAAEYLFSNGRLTV